MLGVSCLACIMLRFSLDALSNNNNASHNKSNRHNHVWETD